MAAPHKSYRCLNCLFNKRMWDNTPRDRIVLFDLETTGTDYKKNDCIIEIAASANNGDRFVSRVKPNVPICAGAKKAHGISDQDLAACEPWSRVGRRFVAWVLAHAGRKPVFVAYNGSRFDVPFLGVELRRIYGKAHPFQAIFSLDPFLVVRKKLQDLKPQTQTNVYKHLFGTPMPNAHSAEGDLLALERICSHELIQNFIHFTSLRLDMDRCVCVQMPKSTPKKSALAQSRLANESKRDKEKVDNPREEDVRGVARLAVR